MIIIDEDKRRRRRRRRRGGGRLVFVGEEDESGHFSKKSETLKGRLPPENSVSRRETLAKQGFRQSCKQTFPSKKKVGGHFSIFESNF